MGVNDATAVRRLSLGSYYHQYIGSDRYREVRLRCILLPLFSLNGLSPTLKLCSKTLCSTDCLRVVLLEMLLGSPFHMKEISAISKHRGSTNKRRYREHHQLHRPPRPHSPNRRPWRALASDQEVNYSRRTSRCQTISYVTSYNHHLSHLNFLRIHISKINQNPSPPHIPS
jgi:hypothetical protein